MGYFLFIYNALIGVFSIFKRVLFSLLIGTLLIARMDYVVLMRGFEFLDSGNAAAQQLFRCPIVTKKMSHVKAEMHQIHFRLGLRLRPCWGSLQCWPDTLAAMPYFYNNNNNNNPICKAPECQKTSVALKGKGKDDLHSTIHIVFMY